MRIHTNEIITRTPNGVICLLLLLVTLGVFSGLANSPLIWDSKTVVLQDPAVDSLRNIPKYFISNSSAPSEYGSSVKGERLAYYRPLMKTFLSVQKSFFGNNPAGYHVVSVLLHSACSILFFLIT